MAISKKLEIIYHNGQPDGIRFICRHLSTMTTYVIPRPLLSEAKKLTGINRPGIYYLISKNDDNKIAQIYIGQTKKSNVALSFSSFLQIRSNSFLYSFQEDVSYSVGSILPQRI